MESGRAMNLVETRIEQKGTKYYAIIVDRHERILLNLGCASEAEAQEKINTWLDSAVIISGRDFRRWIDDAKAKYRNLRTWTNRDSAAYNYNKVEAVAFKQPLINLGLITDELDKEIQTEGI